MAWWEKSAGKAQSGMADEGRRTKREISEDARAFFARVLEGTTELLQQQLGLSVTLPSFDCNIIALSFPSHSRCNGGTFPSLQGCEACSLACSCRAASRARIGSVESSSHLVQWCFPPSGPPLNPREQLGYLLLGPQWPPRMAMDQQSGMRPGKS